MKKGQILEGVIERVDFPNRGLIRTEEGRIVVKNAMPGQKVRFVINKKHGNRAEGRLLEVLEASPLEVRAPACSLFPDCGGCMYQTMAYEEQLAMKSAQVRALIEPVLAEAGQPDYVYDGIKGSPQEFAYRNKMEFSFGDEYKDGPLVLGLHRTGSTYDVLPVTDCAIVHEDFNQIVQTVQEYCRAQGFSYYHKMSHQGYLRHLLVRRAETTGETMVCLVTTSQSPYGSVTPFGKEDEGDCSGGRATNGREDRGDFSFDRATNEREDGEDFSFGHAANGQERHDFAPLGAALRELQAQGRLQGEIIGFLHMINDSPADVVRSDESHLIFGRDYFYETILGLTFRITPFSFFQTNSRGAEVLYSAARDYIGSTKDMTVFDLYSGTGTIAQLIAPVARKVIGVEIVEEAVEAARENARRNGLSNCEFIAGDVLKMLDTIPERPDFIILDPPRDGIHPKALAKIINYGVDRLVYISCKPTSLARDLKVFLENGYRMERMTCVDMFCETQHCETVCLLSNRKPDTKVRIDVDLEDYYRIKDAKKNQN